MCERFVYACNGKKERERGREGEREREKEKEREAAMTTCKIHCAVHLKRQGNNKNLLPLKPPSMKRLKFVNLVSEIKKDDV